MDFVIPSSSPVVTPIKLNRKRKLDDLSPPQDLRDAYPDSPESIHSSDQCSYSSYFERKAKERESSEREPMPNSTFSTFVTAPSQLTAASPQKILSSQQEIEDIAIPLRHIPDLDEGDITIESDACPGSDEEELNGPDLEALAYIRQCCTESVLDTLPVPRD